MRVAHQAATHISNLVMSKTPNSTDSVCVVLIVVVLVAIIEVLVPRVVVIDLRGTPVVVTGKTAHNVL